MFSGRRLRRTICSDEEVRLELRSSSSKSRRALKRAAASMVQEAQKWSRGPGGCPVPRGMVGWDAMQALAREVKLAYAGNAPPGRVASGPIA